MMNKELEALDILRDMTFEQNAFSQERNDAIEIIEKALTPPTEEEVCKALSDYLKSRRDGRIIDKVYYSKEENINHSVLKYLFYYTHKKTKKKKPIVFQNEIGLLHQKESLPPHLITMIGRFYEGVKT